MLLGHHANTLKFDVFVPWTPANLSTISSWHDFSDINTITTDSNNRITLLQDKSGNSINLTPVVSDSGATLLTNSINNLNTGSFNGLNQRMIMNKPFASTGSWFVIQKTSDTSYIILNDGAGNFSLVSTKESTITLLANFFGNPTYYSDGNLKNFANRGEAYEEFNNRVAIAEYINCNISGWSSVGVSNYGTNFYFTGEIGEIISADGLISTEDRQKLEGYLAHKWGLTANLPAFHPYKNNPPTL